MRRTKGWRKPEGAVYVGRPSKWGNPYWHVLRFHGVEKAIALYRNTVRGIWSPSLVNGWGWPDGYVAQVYEDHHDWLRRIGGHPLETMPELTGRDLACWCPLDRPCHADVLLELANAPVSAFGAGEAAPKAAQ